MCRTCYASRPEVLTWSEGSTFLSLAAVKSRLALVISMTSKAVAHIISPPNGECVNVAQQLKSRACKRARQIASVEQVYNLCGV